MAAVGRFFRGLAALARSRPATIGLLLGTAYGVFARFAWDAFGGTFAVMSFAFIFIVPISLGVLTVGLVERAPWWYRAFAPWVPTLIAIVMAVAIGWEGAICVFISLPLLLLLASVGGACGSTSAARRPEVLVAVALLPYIVAPLERGVGAPERLTETVRAIEIDAAPPVVWPLIASVDSIRPEERQPALFTTLGFPAPIKATISGAGVGAVRHARFERGVVFTETVTEWVPKRRLSFAIEPNTKDIPPGALDPHVTVGGDYFDVLTGTYELHPLDGGRRTRLELRSAHRVSTHFNPYAGWWADRIMASIQTNILAVVKARAERVSPMAGGGDRR